MVVFQSMNHVVLFIILTSAALLTLALGKQPFGAAAAFVMKLFTSWRYALYFSFMIFILFINNFELALEKHFNVKYDFTPYFYKAEGHWAGLLQRTFETHWLTYFSTYMYVVVFPCLIVVSIGVFTYTKQLRLVYALLTAVLLNYVLAIPFYVFFPVNEVWSAHAGVRFLIPDVFPAFEQDYRPLSGIDNCFPSLHTSISVTIALIAWRSQTKRWKWMAAFSAVSIIFAIFYLGIHWVSDMLGGLLLASTAVSIGLRWTQGYQDEPDLDPIKWRARTAEK